MIKGDYRNDCYHHSYDEPSVVFYPTKTQYISEGIHYVDDTYVAQLFYEDENIVRRDIWHVGGEIGRLDGPAIVDYDTTGTIIDYNWFSPSAGIVTEPMDIFCSALDIDIKNLSYDDKTLIRIKMLEFE